MNEDAAEVGVEVQNQVGDVGELAAGLLIDPVEDELVNGALAQVAAVNILPKRYAELETNLPFIASIAITPVSKE